MVSWYDDLEAMAADDAVLQRVYRSLRNELTVVRAVPPVCGAGPTTMHAAGRAAYTSIRPVDVRTPSKKCVSLSFRRLFRGGGGLLVSKVRDDDGTLLPDCALRTPTRSMHDRIGCVRHVLLHELAHAINDTHP